MSRNFAWIFSDKLRFLAFGFMIADLRQCHQEIMDRDHEITENKSCTITLLTRNSII